MPQEPSHARRAALALIAEVLDARRMLGAPQGLSGAEAARAQRLAATVLRHLGRLDRVLAPYLDRRPPRASLDILRLGTAELLALEAAPHGVLSDLVEIAKRRKATARTAGLINAVLRRIAAEGAARWADLPPQKLPAWLRKPLTADWGRAAVLAMEAAHERGAPLDLTPHGAVEVGTPLPTGSLRLEGSPQVSDLPGYAEGRFWVQDAAAALPARMLDVGPGMRVLELCAAPGGKTMQLAAAGAEVTALDVSDDRLDRLRQNLARTGLSARIVAADALTWTAGPFDAVLLDAPCTATGTIRRHPDLPFVKTAADLDTLLPLQAALIDRAAALLRPGGRMVYCVCSLMKAEGERQVEAALTRHADLARVPADLPPGLSDAAGALRTRPDMWADLGGLDGFYAAALAKSVT